MHDHFQCKAEILHFFIFAKNRSQSVLDTLTIRILLFVELKDPVDFIVNFLTHLLSYICLLLIQTLTHRLDRIDRL